MCMSKPVFNKKYDVCTSLYIVYGLNEYILLNYIQLDLLVIQNKLLAWEC